MLDYNPDVDGTSFILKSEKQKEEKTTQKFYPKILLIYSCLDCPKFERDCNYIRCNLDHHAVHITGREIDARIKLFDLCKLQETNEKINNELYNREK